MRKYRIKRLYDYCVLEEDYDKFKISSRAIKCKYRLHTGIAISILTITSVIIIVLSEENWYLITLLALINMFWILYMMRMDPYSLLQIRKLKNLMNKKDKTIYDIIIIYLNNHNCFLKFHTKHYIKTKDYPFNWQKFQIVFCDEKKNYYYYTVTNNELILSIQHETKDIESNNKTNIVLNLTDISTVKEFQKLIRDHFFSIKTND